MGVQGLSSFVELHSKKYKEIYRLHNTKLVIDGYNLAYHLCSYADVSNQMPFGGDYYLYEKTVREFFNILIACEVEPYVVFDGGSEEAKLETALQRMKDKISTSLRISPSSNTLMLPFMAIQVFVDTLRDLGVSHICCIQEADKQIASLALKFDCPVLSNDSDFIIYGTKVISLNSLDIRVHSMDRGDDVVTNFLFCEMFNLNKFLRDFSGMDHSLLPLAASLLGNDYIDCIDFDAFYSHINIRGGGGLGDRHRVIQSLFTWISGKQEDEIILCALKHVQRDRRKTVKKLIRTSLKQYMVPTEPSFMGYITQPSSTCIPNEAMSSLLLPQWFWQDYCTCRLPAHLAEELVDIAFQNTVLFTPLVEESTKPNAYAVGLPILQVMCAVILADSDKRGDLEVTGLKCFGRVDKAVEEITLKPLFAISGFGKVISLGDVTDVPITQRVEFVKQSLQLNSDDFTFVNEYPENQQLFVMSLIYWIRHSQLEKPEYYIFATMLCFLTMTMIRKKGRKKRNDESTVLFESEKHYSLEELHSMVSYSECYTTFTAIKQYMKPSSSKGEFRRSIMQALSEFQVCYSFTCALNHLMRKPFSDLRPTYVYCGSLLYKVVHEMQDLNDTRSFIDKIFGDAVRLKALCMRLCEPLFKLFLVELKSDHKQTAHQGKRKKRKKRNTPVQKLRDANNLFSLLSEEK